MGLRDSRHTSEPARWGITTGETVDANVVEPPGSQQNTGWVPEVDVPVTEWFNWLSHKTYLALEYVQSIATKRWLTNHLPRSLKGVAVSEVTAGVGLSVNVTAGYAIIQGSQYQIPAATNLALAAADATHPRNDLIVAEFVGGVPVYDNVTGTPGAVPADPSIADNQVAVARVRVNATAVVPSTITDLRVFGALPLDDLLVDEHLLAGDMGSDDWLINMTTASNGILRLVDTGTLLIGGGLLSVIQGAAQVLVDAAAFRFTAPITRTYDIALEGFPVQINVTRGSGLGGGWGLEGDTTGTVRAPVHLPNGATVTAIRLYTYRATNVPGLSAFVRTILKTTGASGTVGAGVASNAGSGATGNLTQEVTGLSHVVDQTMAYELEVTWEGTGDITLRAAEIEYTELTPFLSL